MSMTTDFHGLDSVRPAWNADLWGSLDEARRSFEALGTLWLSFRPIFTGTYSCRFEAPDSPRLILPEPYARRLGTGDVAAWADKAGEHDYVAIAPAPAFIKDAIDIEEVIANEDTPDIVDVLEDQLARMGQAVRTRLGEDNVLDLGIAASAFDRFFPTDEGASSGNGSERAYTIVGNGDRLELWEEAAYTSYVAKNSELYGELYWK